jgi:flagella basal body P-ring formation protein FlgA
MFVSFAYATPLLAQHGKAHAAHAATPYATATRDLPRGTVLAVDDIQWMVDTGEIGSSAKTPAAMAVPAPHDTTVVTAGWITRRPFRAGDVLDEPGVSRADVVTTGDVVDVIYRNDRVSIRLTGTVIGNGAPGDRVYVKLQNRKRLRGVVTGPHTVRVGL